MFSSSLGRYSLLPTASSMANFGDESLLESSSSVIRVVEPNNKLSTFFGVVVPVILSMFSVILFLRLGFVVGQAGLVLAIGMLVTAYFVVGLTILSISAIATNGTVKGGGAYYMISRTLGPEFGGSIGIIFYFANIFASALYILGFVEAFLNSFPAIFRLFQDYSYLYHFLCGSVVLLLCLGVCLIGAGMFAKTSFIIFLIVMAAMFSSFISFFIMKKSSLKPGIQNQKSVPMNATYKYTSWDSNTFHSNLLFKFGKDYTTHDKQNTLIVFGVLFNGVTGIMAGANISGDLKNPGYAIPFGTLAASLFTFIIYVVLIFFTSATCSRGLLQNNYNYIQVINKVPPLVSAGAFAATLSASLSCLIGASRILQALAQDDLLVILRPFAKVNARRREPWRAVLMSWLFVQAIIAIGNLNAVAGLVSMFFLLSYGVTNMACFALKVASAPNFRPTFQYFSWQTALLGALLCFTIMFLINPMYAAIALAVMVILFVLISLRAPPTPWGDVSQALIYHQVRKYLLRLDLRKHHVKFWRPQVLLLVSNPRSSYPLIDFVNDIKKSGLYILGHVQVGEFNAHSLRSQELQLSTWLNFVDCTELKAFVELIVAPSIRIGAQNLLMTSGLGGMKPNTLILGFFDYELPEEHFSRGILRKPRFFWMRGQRKDELYRRVQEDLAMLRAHPGDQKMTLKGYVGIIKDAVVMGKNVCIARNFSQLDKNTLGRDGYIDVWPMNSTVMTELFGSYDYTFLLILQLSCVLHMVPFWECRTKLRVMQIVEANDEDSRQEQEQSLSRLLKELRIPAEVRMVHVTREFQFQARNADGMAPSTNWYRTVNQLMRIHSGDAFVVFTGLPSPPAEENMAQQFIQDITILSDHLPPIMMVYGNSPVVTTSL